MKLVRFFAVALAASALGAFGCSSSDTTGNVIVKDSGATDTKTDTATSPTDSGTKPDTATATCDVDAGTNCSTASCGDSNACFECLSNGDSAGYQAYVNALLGACACTAGTTCYSACSTTQACGGTGAVDACVTCVNGLSSSDACISTFGTKCKADSACLGFVTAANDQCP